MSEPQDAQPGEGGDSRLVEERRAKLAALRAAGVEPFPNEFPGREEIAAVRARHGGLEPGVETEARHRIAGRLLARRGMGKVAFLDLEDGAARIQIQSRLDLVGEEAHRGLLALDLGDLVGIDGVAMMSRRGELTIQVEAWTLLAKSLRPPPDKHHGLRDVETRYRHRELDLLSDPEVRQLFRTRAEVIAEVRRSFDEWGFVEVETPVLQPIYGGALARPFTTHHNALDARLYLRIATELYLKRCVVGGIEKVYEVGKNFRNEGISHKHNPEFTMLEWYEAYADYEDGAGRLERLIAAISERVLGSTVVERNGVDIDFKAPWKRLTLSEAIAAETGVDITTKPSRRELAEPLGRKPADEEVWGKLVDALLSKFVEPKLIQPTFLFDYPEELSPFAKAHRSKPGVVERWEMFCGGIELANAFSELNDPDEQRRRFSQQAAELQRGDDEAQPHDEDFLFALEHGMPPTSGVGLGIDRLVMILTGASNLREVLLFPAMRDAG